MSVLLAGLCTVDVVQRVAELPEPGRKVQSTSVALAAGGPATNAAVTVAALGYDARLVTVLGSHPLAELARADLHACGVHVVDVLPDHPHPPPMSAVTVRDRDGERTVVSHNAGSAPRLTFPAHATGEPPDVDAVLVDGHHPELALGAARWARTRGCPVVVDAGSWRPVFTDLLPLADVVACSAQFTAPEDALRPVPAVITTAGAAPVRWRAGGASGAVAVPEVDARDTLGAGDVWHGALAASIGGRARRGGADTPGAPGVLDDIPELIEFANAVAAERVRHVGPRSWLAPIRAMMGAI